MLTMTMPRPKVRVPGEAGKCRRRWVNQVWLEEWAQKGKYMKPEAGDSPCTRPHSPATVIYNASVLSVFKEQLYPLSTLCSFFVFIMLGVCTTSWICELISLISLGKFLAIISSKTAFVPPCPVQESNHTYFRFFSRCLTYPYVLFCMLHI